MKIPVQEAIKSGEWFNDIHYKDRKFKCKEPTVRFRILSFEKGHINGADVLNDGVIWLLKAELVRLPLFTFTDVMHQWDTLTDQYDFKYYGHHHEFKSQTSPKISYTGTFLLPDDDELEYYINGWEI